MKNRSTQSDTNMDFDGMARTGTGRVNQKMMTNQWSGHMNDGREVNFGRGPTRGNMGCGKPGQPGATKSVTMDSYRDAPTTKTVPSTKINADRINAGAQVRTPGGTRSWDPKCEQNYAGNPDKIRMGQTGGPAYGKVTKGSRPSTAAGSVDFNYGPGKQY
jgi:hypothetical protein